MISRVEFCYNCLVPILTIVSYDAVVGPDSALGPACGSLGTGTFSCTVLRSVVGEDPGSSTQSRIMPIWIVRMTPPWHLQFNAN